MTLPFGPAVHYGFHPLQQTRDHGDDDCINPSVLDLSYEMTRNNAAVYGFSAPQQHQHQQLPLLDLNNLAFDLPVDDGQSFAQTQIFPSAPSESTRSPGRNSHLHGSEDTGSPLSQIVYTPSSSHEYDACAIDISERGALDDEDDPTKSPLSDSIFSSTTDSSFYMVNCPDPTESFPSAARQMAMTGTRPQPQAAASGASGQLSRASSITHSSTPSRTSAAQWTGSLSAPQGVMGTNTNDLPSGAFGDADGFTFGTDTFSMQDHQNLRYDLMQNLNTPEDTASNTFRAVNSSFRPFDDVTQQDFGNYTYTTGSPFNQTIPPAQQLRERQHYFANQYQQSQMLFPRHDQAHQTPASIGHYAQQNTQPIASLGANHPTAMSAVPPGIAQTSNMPMRPQQSRPVVHQSQSASSRAAPYPQPYKQAQTQVATYQSSHHHRASHSLGPNSTSTAPSRRVHLAPREVKRPVVPSNAPPAVVQNAASRKGGRAKHTHLADDVRLQTSKMRGVTACWRCALQRDKCDDGEECRRCAIRSQKGGRDMFGCDRSKLPEWIEDLLPLSMTEMHTKDSIETFVTEQVTRWNTNNSIDIYLTSGYGPPLIWRCCEFQPKDQELLGQLQYLQETSTGIEQRRVKYSPPFALKKLDESDDAHFKEYLETQLMHPNVLKTLGWTFYEEECIVDAHCFQARILELMCTLFIESRDPNLRAALQDVIHMLIVTYIMGHTLTIAEDTLPTVLASVRYTPEETCHEQHTSPRLANRQLKHYFSALRHTTYLRVLHRQQQTFHDSKKKEAHWLVSFTAMLAFAMVLEEIQRTIQIQADAKWAKGEMGREAAAQEALNHCQRIDDKFARMVFFFQKKYRDRKWGDDGSFGPKTPNYRTLPEARFLGELYDLLLQRQDHLRSRESVPLGPEFQCKYTTRLVAKFLLPFLTMQT